MKKVKATKIVVRKTLREKLDAERLAGVDTGYAQGRHDTRFEFRPNPTHQKNITDVVRMIESWGMLEENGLIMIAGTDLQHHCNAAVPLRLLRVIAEELKRFGYKP
jgi:hypothetical protein